MGVIEVREQAREKRHQVGACGNTSCGGWRGHSGNCWYGGTGWGYGGGVAGEGAADGDGDLGEGEGDSGGGDLGAEASLTAAKGKDFDWDTARHYLAETTFTANHEHRQYSGIDEAQAHADKIAKYEDISSPRVISSRGGPGSVYWHSGRYGDGDPEIGLAPDHMHEAALIHEMTHHMRHATGMDDGHGPNFSRSYGLALWDHHSRPEAARKEFQHYYGAADEHMRANPEHYPEPPQKTAAASTPPGTMGTDSEGHRVQMTTMDGWAHDDGSHGHEDNTNVGDKPVYTQTHTWLPHDRYWGPNSAQNDQRLFDGDHLKPALRRDLLEMLNGYMRPRYKNWPLWTKAYFAGSQAARWLDESGRGNGDFDMLIGIEFTLFRRHNPEYDDMDDESIAKMLTDGMHRSINDDAYHPPV